MGINDTLTDYFATYSVAANMLTNLFYNLPSTAADGDPMSVELVVALLVGTACWLLGVFTKDYSWIDRLWSLLPPAYIGYFAYSAEFKDTRLVLIFALTLAWGARLTYNFYRKGGYRVGHQDYRWPIVRKWFGPVTWQLFNCFFIGYYQSWLLMMLAAPAYVCWLNRGGPLNAVDYVATALFVLGFLLEVTADEQQWRFHKEKAAAAGSRNKTGDVKRGFLSSGLFAYSRHPNFFGEQCMWWAVYVFSVAASGRAANWSLLGAALLSLLFLGSVRLTEGISLKKYPAYKKYMKTTSRLVPRPPGPPLGKD